MFDFSKEYKIVNGVLLAILLILAITPFTIKSPDSAQIFFPFQEEPLVCFVKQQTGKLCSSCGLTRSVVALYSGNWSLSRAYHPAGYLFVLILIFEIIIRFIIIQVKSRWVPFFDISQILTVGLLFKIVLIAINPNI